MASKLRVSFLRPIDLETPLPAHSESDQVISAADIRVYRHSATANSNEKQRLALGAFVAQCEGDNAFLIPRGRELNEDKIVFQKYEEVALYCGLDIVDLGHLCGPTMVQGKVWTFIIRTCHGNVLLCTGTAFAARVMHVSLSRFP